MCTGADSSAGGAAADAGGAAVDAGGAAADVGVDNADDGVDDADDDTFVPAPRHHLRIRVLYVTTCTNRAW